jgi:hypothetical protein
MEEEEAVEANLLALSGRTEQSMPYRRESAGCEGSPRGELKKATIDRSECAGL